MVPSEAVRVVVPNVKRSVPGGGSFLWRGANRGVIATIGLASKGFMKLQRNVQVEGMDEFLKILESKRDRGVITVSNHLLDDPLLWGLLPTRTILDPRKTRWALGAVDICFTNSYSISTAYLIPRLYSLFFTLGQTLPINRYPPWRPRGINQPSMNHAITLLNDPYNSWVHIFPEARIYQAPSLPMRFFKMGISKLILEPTNPPIIIPMFHSGMENVMVEQRNPPQFLPSTGQDIRVKFGEPIPLETIERLRKRWGKVKEHPSHKELRILRIETAETVRDAVNAVRTSMGFPLEPGGSNDPESFPPDTVPHRKDVKRWFKRFWKDP